MQGEGATQRCGRQEAAIMRATLGSVCHRKQREGDVAMALGPEGFLREKEGKEEEGGGEGKRVWELGERH